MEINFGKGGLADKNNWALSTPEVTNEDKKWAEKNFGILWSGVFELVNTNSLKLLSPQSLYNLTRNSLENGQKFRTNEADKIPFQVTLAQSISSPGQAAALLERALSLHKISTLDSEEEKKLKKQKSEMHKPLYSCREIIK